MDLDRPTLHWLDTSGTNSVSWFSLWFDPSATGDRWATIRIQNNVPGKNPYTFDVKGAGL